MRKWTKGAGLPLDQRTLGLRGKSDRGAFCLRVARRLGKLVPVLGQRKLGIQRRRRPDEHLGLSDLGL
jgi:hypothetical protein